jgi:hypothetical protein
MPEIAAAGFVPAQAPAWIPAEALSISKEVPSFALRASPFVKTTVDKTAGRQARTRRCKSSLAVKCSEHSGLLAREFPLLRGRVRRKATPHDTPACPAIAPGASGEVLALVRHCHDKGLIFNLFQGCGSSMRLPRVGPSRNRANPGLNVSIPSGLKKGP